MSINDFALAFSLLSVILAGIALARSWWHTNRDVELTTNATEIQVVADLYRQVRAPEFLAHLKQVFGCPSDLDLPKGFESLPPPLRESAYAVCYFFEHLGVLIANRLIPPDTILATMSSLLSRAWLALEGAIEAERKYRRESYPPDVSATFLPHYETVVRMAKERALKRRVA